MDICTILNKKTIDIKSECYLLYQNGFFGNKPLIWNSLEEVIASGWRGKICIRGKKRIERSRVKYNLRIKQAVSEIQKFEREGINVKDLTFNQAMPDSHLLIQGEIMRSENLYDLTYSTVRKPMNEALAEEELTCYGMGVLFLLKENLFPASYEDLQTLFDFFPDSVIEFSSYDIPVGDLPGRNTIFWEVRNY